MGGDEGGFGKDNLNGFQMAALESYTAFFTFKMNDQFL